MPALVLAAAFAVPVAAADPAALPPPPAALAPFFRPPAAFANDLGPFRSPLLFADGTPVKTPADWQRRRKEIRDTWHALMGPWPEPVAAPTFEVVETSKQDGFTRHKVKAQYAPGRVTPDAYLLVPDGTGPFPAVVHVGYNSETTAGLAGEPVRQRALAMVRQGFVCLCVGGYDDRYPSKEKVAVQPLSFLAYAAATLHTALARRPEVDPKRVGIFGHSFGAKWAMFASCLDDRWAAAAWSDGGLVFDEARSNVNYWEAWYLGWDPAVRRAAGVITPDRPRTGAYKVMIGQGRDLHELHALMAPRPFLANSGAEDPPARWVALNHAVAVNKFLGYDDRVMATGRKSHAPTAESNAQMVEFFQWALQGGIK